MINKTRFVALTLGLAMVFGVAAPASAVTIAELQAQIEALMAQLAALQGGSSATATTFTQNLTVGSTGSEVTALQQMLVAKGHLVMPAGVAYGYFGPLTKSAVAAWQAANGVAPAVGYWGPISRAAANAAAPSTPGTATPGSTAGITTPGVEGTITASKNPSPASGVKVYEAGSKVGVLGIKLEAKTSDIRVERVKVQLVAASSGRSDQEFYTKIADRMYVMDGSTVLASVDLNSDTVVKETSSYYVTITGFNLIVPKDATKVLTIAIDPKASWDSTYDSKSWTVTVPANGVRGTDGAGINQYSPTATFNNSFTSTADLTESATLAVSTNANTPVAALVIAADGSSENELDGLELLRVDLRAEKDDVTVTDAILSITRGGTTTTASSTTAYLYDGNTLVGSATVAGTAAETMTATFSDIDYVIPAGTTKTLSAKVDIDTAGTAGTTFVGSIAASTGITAERSDGTAVSESGSATGETITIRSAGPQFSLVSSDVTYTAPLAIAGATSTAKATFVINIKAVGGDLYFGTQAASSTFQVGTWKGGVNTAADYVNASTTSYVTPSSGVTTTGLPAAAVAFKLAENQSVNVTVETIFPGRLSTGALLDTDGYAFGIKKINWSTSGNDTQSTTYMDGKTSWRTSSVTLP